MGKQQKKSLVSSFNRLCISTLFVVAFLSIVLHLVYIYSEEPTVNPQQVYLHRTFKKEPYSKIYEAIVANKYSALKTTCRDCTNEIINYYGYKNSKTIVHRDYTVLEEIEAQVMPYFWTVRTFIRNTIFEKQPNKLWVFWVNKQIPRQDINLIKLFEPESSIIIVSLAGSTKSKIKEKGFKDIGKVEEFDLVKLLKAINFSKKQAEGYVRYHDSSIPAIFTSILRKFNIQQELGASYANITSLSKKTRSIVRRVCVNGTNKAVRVNDTIKGQLESAGVLIENSLPKWKNEQFILNYMLQSKEKCTREQFAAIQKPKQAESQPESDAKCVCKPKKSKKAQVTLKNQTSAPVQNSVDNKDTSSEIAPPKQEDENQVVAVEKQAEAQPQESKQEGGEQQDQDDDDQKSQAQSAVEQNPADQNEQTVSEPPKEESPKQASEDDDDQQDEDQKDDDDKDEAGEAKNEKVDSKSAEPEQNHEDDEDDGDDDDEDEDKDGQEQQKQL